MSSKISTLDNGLRVLTVNVPNSMSVAVMALVRVGSRYESAEENGLAHFVEHMFFKGTEKRPSSRQIAMDIEQIGGSSNAFTSRDYTGYYIKVPKQNSEKAIDILGDMLTNGIFRQEEVEKERGVIIEEIRMYEDRPPSKVSSIWNKTFFGDVPMGRDIVGTVETVSSFDVKNFEDFVKKNYVGENTIFVVVGDVDHKNVEDLVAKDLGNLPKGQKAKFQVVSESTKKSEIFNLKKDLEQSHLMIGGYSQKRDAEYDYIWEVVDTILSKGFGSRLFQTIREELGLAYYVYSSIVPYEDIGTFKVGLGVENSKIDLAVNAVLRELKALINGKFDDEELERAKNYLLGNIVTDLETSDDLALWYGIQELLEDQHDDLEVAAEKITSVTKDQVLDRLQSVLKGQSLLLTGVTPHENLPEKLVDSLKI